MNNRLIVRRVFIRYDSFPSFHSRNYFKLTTGFPMYNIFGIILHGSTLIRTEQLYDSSG